MSAVAQAAAGDWKADVGSGARVPVTVVIAARNEAAEIAECIASVS